MESMTDLQKAAWQVLSVWQGMTTVTPLDGALAELHQALKKELEPLFAKAFPNDQS